MSRTEPRVQYHFGVIQTPKDKDYIPLPARDEDRVALFEGGPRGIVIATDQKIGSRAIAETFDWAVYEGAPDDLLSASRMFAYTSLGTAYHLYAQNATQKVMYRQVPLPQAVDVDTGEYATRSEFIESVQADFEDIADTASRIKNDVIAQQNVNKMDIPLGRTLARVGLTLAAIADEVPGVRLGKVGTQERAYESAQLAYVQMLELSGTIGARPTIAQIANRHSPLMQHLHDNRQSVSQNVYNKLTTKVEQLIEDEPKL